MVMDVLVAVGHHRTPTVPTLTPDYVDLLREEGISGADYGSDVEVVFEVLDRHMERMTLGVEIVDDRFELPIAIKIDHVAVVADAQQVGIEPWIVGKRTLPWSDTRSCSTVEIGGVVVGCHDR